MTDGRRIITGVANKEAKSQRGDESSNTIHTHTYCTYVRMYIVGRGVLSRYAPDHLATAPPRLFEWIAVIMIIGVVIIRTNEGGDHAV